MHLMLWLVQAIRGYRTLSWKVDLSSTKFTSTRCNYVLGFPVVSDWHSILLLLFMLLSDGFVWYRDIHLCSYHTVFTWMKICFWKLQLTEYYQSTIWASTGTFMSAFCNTSVRHLRHLPKTLPFRFLNTDAVSLGFVQIFLTLNILWAPVGPLFLIISGIDASASKIIVLNLSF